jgi:hypothetical protein
MAERNFSDTGAQSGGSGKYIKIKSKEGKFELPDETKSDTFAGYLGPVSMEFKDPSTEHDLPARWEIKLSMDAMLPGDPETGAQYNIALSSHWRSPVMANLLNGIRGALEDPRWEDPQGRYIRIWLTLKEPGGGKRPYCSALAFMSKTKGDYLPNFYKWNDDGQFYDGVPRDMAEADTFWLSVAHAIVKLTGGVVINADKASIPLPPPDSISLGDTPPVAPPTGLSIVDKAKAFLTKELGEGKVFIETVGKAFAALTANNATGGDFRMFAAHCTNIGLKSGALPFGYIKSDGSWEQTAPGEQPTTEVAPPVNDLDLPF